MHTQTSDTIEQPVSLAFHFTESLKFYQTRSVEITTIQEEAEKDEVQKMLHVTLRKAQPDHYQAHVEIFERKHKNRAVSATEKEFYAQMATVYDDLQLLLTREGQMGRIDNLPSVQKKMRQKIKKLSTSYVGNRVADAFRFYRNFYQTEKPLMRKLARYNHLGFLFHPWYGAYPPGTVKTNRRRYTNLVKNTIIHIDEQATLGTCKADGQHEIEILLSGRIGEPFRREVLETILNNRKIPFDPAKDAPRLEQYEGKITLCSETGVVKKAYLHIQFSFGPQYQKQITYELTELDDEEIQIDEP